MPKAIRPKGLGSVYQRKSDGRWCAAVELPASGGGRRRKVITLPMKDTLGKSEKQIEEMLGRKVRTLLGELKAHGDLPTAGQTLESWLNVWFESIALKKIRPKTASAYRYLLESHIIPTIGAERLDRLTPAHIRRVEDAITGKGLSSSTAHQAYRILVVALKYAHVEGRIASNVARETDSPRRSVSKMAVLTAAEGRKVIDTTRGDRLGSRWAAALLTGARQGELLGLELDRISDGMLDLSWQLQRVPWEHGCKAPCGSLRGSECPDRKIVHPADWERRYLTGGLWLCRPKSAAGTRVVPIVPELAAMLEERFFTIASEPNPFGLMWTADALTGKELTGAPIDPSRDNKAWHAALARATVTDVRLHDARHTTASLLLKAGVPEAGIMRILGHNSYAVTRGYQNVDAQQLMDWMKSAAAVMSPSGEVLQLEALSALPEQAPA
jgi:integrase